MNSRIGSWLGCLVLVHGMLAAQQSAPEAPVFVRFRDQVEMRDFGAFELTGPGLREVPGDAWCEVFTVRVAPSPGLPLDLPAIVGSYRSIPGGIRFAPRFPPSPGVIYRVRVDLPGGSRIERAFSLPVDEPVATARVDRVYPSAPEIPANALRFYVHFSEPMRRGQVVDRIVLLDERGRIVPSPFLTGPIGELWDHDRRRLTLLLDPGRIKRGVMPNARLGPALVEGATRVLVIRSGMRSAAGASLREEFRQSFRVTAPVRSALEPSEWHLTPPQVGTRCPLTVSFPHVMDHGLLQHAFVVCGAGGEALRGRCEAKKGERQWLFIPSEPWGSESHVLRVPVALEDVAGNNLRSAMDVEAGAPRSGGRIPVELAFTPVRGIDARQRRKP